MNGTTQTETPVTALNFPRAESDWFFGNVIKQSGGIQKLVRFRQVTPLDQQTGVRMNRDTLYTAGVFDLDAGPVTITLPDAGKRYEAMQIINEDEYTPMVVYGKSTTTLTKEKIGTRYVLAGIRMLVDPNDPADLDEVHKLQDAVTVTQANPGTFDIPKWDKASHDKVRDALLVLGATLPDTHGMFGTRAEVDPVRYLIGSASAWGANPEKDAFYLNIVPPNNDGSGVFKLTVKDVPVEAFWSISVYNAQGYFQQNRYNAYSVNNITGKKDPDGAVTVQFGGCDGKAPNCLPIMPGWSYFVRLYRPSAEILNGTYKFPELRKVS